MSVERSRHVGHGSGRQLKIRNISAYYDRHTVHEGGIGVDVGADPAAAHFRDQFHGAPQLLIGPALRYAGGVPAKLHADNVSWGYIMVKLWPSVQRTASPRRRNR